MEVVYVGLYLLIFVVLLIGYLLSVVVGVKVVYFGLWELLMLFDKSDVLKDIFSMVYEWLNWSMVVIVVLYVLVVFKYYVVDCDGMLCCMVFFFC